MTGKQQKHSHRTEDVMEQLQTILSYLLLPIVMPVIFIQQCVAWIKEQTGFDQRKMEGKVVLITGASSGIGEALAHVFYNAGCRLILSARRKNELVRVKEDLLRNKSTGKVYVPAILEMDVGDLSSIEQKAKTASDLYGSVDILINNAGISNRGSFLDTDVDVHVKVMNVNYFGTLALTKALLGGMIGRKSGQIVFIGSVQGKISVPHRSAYAASKHAMQALADSLRAETAFQGISVTMISPGYVQTNISLNALTASGSPHGQMDESTAKGFTTKYLADRVFKAVVNKEKDVVISQFIPKIAIFLRQALPSLFFFLMAKRADKEQ